MTSRDFCYWLQGYFEIGNATSEARQMNELSSGQVECIKRHLSMVFKHEIDPSMGDEKTQKLMTAIHLGKVDPKINC